MTKERSVLIVGLLAFLGLCAFAGAFILGGLHTDRQRNNYTYAISAFGVALLIGAGVATMAAIFAAQRARLAALHAYTARALRERETQLSLFVEGAPAAIAMFDGEMRYLAVSRRFITDHRLTGEPNDLVGRCHYELFPDTPQRWRDIHARALAGGTENCDADPFPRDDGRTDWVRWRMEPWRDAAGQIGGALLFAEVITQLKEAEAALSNLNAELEQRVQERTAQLVQAQKMEAVGQLSGGVAHDFNNLLQGIGNCLAALDRHIPDGIERTLFQAAQQAIERGARLTQSLLAFARRQTLAPESINLVSLVEGMRPLLERTLGGLIHINIDMPTDIGPAMADPAQLEAAVVNLAINARDAMALGGELTIRAANASVQHAGETGRPASLQPGDYVVVSVEDTGSGMSPATLARAFEPFFTTKEVDKGSGLGLSMVHGMAAQSGGGVHITSALGVGTTVSIYLPCAKPAAASASAPRRGKTRGGGRVVLLVDDDYFVRAGTAIVLETLGYNVLAAESGTAALKILRHESAVDALVTDYAMAGMNGMNLIAEARRLLPRLPALLMTGYPVKPDGIKASAILFKPFQPQDLERRLADILRNGPPTDAASASSVGSG